VALEFPGIRVDVATGGREVMERLVGKAGFRERILIVDEEMERRTAGSCWSNWSLARRDCREK